MSLFLIAGVVYEGSEILRFESRELLDEYVRLFQEGWEIGDTWVAVIEGELLEDETHIVQDGEEELRYLKARR